MNRLLSSRSVVAVITVVMTLVLASAVPGIALAAPEQHGGGVGHQGFGGHPGPGGHQNFSGNRGFVGHPNGGQRGFVGQRGFIGQRGFVGHQRFIGYPGHRFVYGPRGFVGVVPVPGFAWGAAYPYAYPNVYPDYGSAPSGNYWYYCQSLGAYYPNVDSCPEGWVTVPAG